jgi:hypothetical protein
MLVRINIILVHGGMRLDNWLPVLEEETLNDKKMVGSSSFENATDSCIGEKK